jgi:two-component system, OmpR family, response regulator
VFGLATAPTVLIVDDDPHLREVLRFALSQAGFRVEEAADGSAGLERARRDSFALIILDLMMPEMDGLEVCRALRTFSRVPIVFLSSRDDEVDRILGLELGGDDYVTKPFSPRELVARVRAVLRRTTPGSADLARRPERLQRGPLRLDLEQWRAHWEAQEVVLTATELTLVATLLRAPGKVFSREDLMTHVYEDAIVSERTIDSHVRRVRQKFAAVGGEVVETVHGVGYRLAIP